MIQITDLTDNANQLHHITLDNGDIIDLNLKFMPVIQKWILNVNSPKLTINGLMLTKHPNLLRQYKNTSNFGLFCLTYDNVDPFMVTDFTNKRVFLFILSEDEIPLMENAIKV